MSFSLYYDARRDYPLTESETAESNKIIEKYCDSFPFKGEAEEFCVYPGYDESSVFYGSTKLPDFSEDALLSAVQHWTSCLSEIHEVIKDCEWSVNLDDNELVWTDDGWWFPEE